MDDINIINEPWSWILTPTGKPWIFLTNYPEIPVAECRDPKTASHIYALHALYLKDKKVNHE